MHTWLNKYLTPLDYKDPEKNRVAATLNLILLALLATSVFLIVDDWFTRDTNNLKPLLFLTIVVLVSFWLTRRGQLQLPRLLVPVMVLLIISYIILVNDSGIHDIAMQSYPAVIVLAGLLLGKRAPFIFAGLCLGVIAFICYAEVNGLINSRLSFMTSYSDLISITIILVITAGLVQILMNNMIDSLERIRLHETTLIEANQQLQAYTQQLEQQEEALRQARDAAETVHELVRQQEAYLRAILNNLPFRVWLKDLEGRFLAVNETFVRTTSDLLDAQAIIGKTDFDITLPELAEKYRADDLAIIESKTQKSVEEFVIYHDQVKWSETYKTPILDENGQVLGTTGFARDITERKQAEEERESLIKELEIKNTELEHFTYTVSHDLKSPLVTIKGFLGWLEKDIASGNTDRTQRDIQHIREAATKMQDLLDDLLELSRIGRLINPPQTISLADLAGEARQLVTGQIEAHGVQVEIAPDLPAVWGDRTRLVEVLQNLLDNAIKFMGPQPAPQIMIGFREVDGENIFFVRDNGQGIEPRYHQKIFGLFERLDQNVEGTGIGLALVKRIIEIHGGRIWVESEGAGRGSTFCFTLPKAL